MTNREVAAALFVTAKTVEYHLGHVYDKFGIRSRSELAKILATRDLPDAGGSMGGPQVRLQREVFKARA